MLTTAGFELGPSGYRSAALPVELSSPQELKVSLIQFKCSRYSRDNLTLSIRMDAQCFNFIFFNFLVDSIAQQVERRTGISKVRVQIPLESTFFRRLRECRLIMKLSFHNTLRMILK